MPQLAKRSSPSASAIAVDVGRAVGDPATRVPCRACRSPGGRSRAAGSPARARARRGLRRGTRRRACRGASGPGSPPGRHLRGGRASGRPASRASAQRGAYARPYSGCDEHSLDPHRARLPAGCDRGVVLLAARLAICRSALAAVRRRARARGRVRGRRPPPARPPAAAGARAWPAAGRSRALRLAGRAAGRRGPRVLDLPARASAAQLVAPPARRLDRRARLRGARRLGDQPPSWLEQPRPLDPGPGRARSLAAGEPHRRASRHGHAATPPGATSALSRRPTVSPRSAAATPG